MSPRLCIIFLSLTCLNTTIGQFLACTSSFDLHANADPIIFEKEWFAEGFTSNELSLELSANGTLIGIFEFGVSQWTDAAMYAGQTIVFELIDTETGNNCFGEFNLFYNGNSTCIVRYTNGIQINPGFSNDVNIDWLEFLEFDSSCDKAYELTFSNQNGIFGPYLSNLGESLFIEDGASLVSNKSITTLNVVAPDNQQDEQYIITFGLNRFFSPWLIDWSDMLVDERTYESSSINSSSVISGGGHRMYSACDPFNEPEFHTVTLIDGFEVILGTSFTIK